MKTATRLLPWLIAFALLFVVYRSVPLGETVAAIGAVGVWEWLLLIGANGLVLLVLNGRWWLILLGLGQRVPFGALFGYRLAAFGVSYFTPGPHFGGEPVQVLLLERRHGVRRETAVASVALDKMMELLVNFTFLVGGALYLLQAGLVSGGVGGQTALYALLLLAIPAGLFWGIWAGKRPFSTTLRWLQRWLTQPKIATFLQKISASVQTSEREMTQACRQAPAVMWGAFGLSLLSWVGIVWEYGLSLSFLGLALTFNQVLLLLIAARIAILLPLPAGIGTLESSQVLGLGLLGLETAIGISITLIIRARDVVLGLVGVWWGIRMVNGKR